MAEDFKVEAGIKITRTQTIYPFSSMKVGDSFLVKFGVVDIQSVRSSMSQHGRRTKTHFKSRKVQGGFRVWRTK